MEAVQIDLVVLQVKILDQLCSLLCDLLNYFPQQPLGSLNGGQDTSRVFVTPCKPCHITLVCLATGE
jgi:hypothetical protein